METYKFDDLNQKSIEELQNIAAGLGIKKFKDLDKENLSYAIIDEAAVAASANAKEVQPKKRGRKPKSEKVAEEVLDQETPKEAPQPEAETPAAKKRGRKKKKAAETTAQESAEVPATDLDSTEKAEQAEKANNHTGKKHNRKGKKGGTTDAPAAEQAPLQELPTAQEPNVAEVNSATEGAAQEADKAAAQDTPGGKGKFTPRPDSSLSEFFPQHSQGKQFKPRTEQEKNQEKAQDTAATPDQDTAADNAATAQPQQQLSYKQRKRQKFLERQQQAQQAQQEVMAKFDNIMQGAGVLEIDQQGNGVLRSSDFNYMPSPDDISLDAHQIKQWGLRMGDVVEGTIRPPREGEKCYPMTEIKSVNGRDPRFMRDRQMFEHLTPLFPDEKFNLCGSPRTTNLSTRVVDMFAPIGKGQRALIVAPPKTGKTILLKDIANAIAENHPETYIMILLIDERPEEVTDMMRTVNAEVIASTFDEPADRHVRIAGIVLEKAKRMVESGHDVVILLDSITRLARAYNTVAPGSGKILSGGVDANALQRPKRFFGAARNIENGGSLTIIATALTETSSKMDEVIFEEFKGTGNMELQLDRKLSNKRIFPAVDIMASSTRRDDLLLDQDTINRMWIMRRFLSDRTSIESMEFIKDRMERTHNNEELLRTMGD